MPSHAQRRTVPYLRLLLPIAVGSAVAVCGSALARAETPVKFRATFMRQLDGYASDAGALALDALANGQDLAPGRYLVSIEVNQSFFDKREVTFSAHGPSDELAPCLTLQLIKDIGVRLDGLVLPESAPDACVDLGRLIPGATAQLQARQLLLSISVPQIAMRRDVAGYIDPSRWEDGINAAFVNYQAAVQQGHSRRSGPNSNQYLYLNSGVNLGPWRLRSSNAFRNDSQGEREWSRAYTYAQRDLPGTHSQLTLGETFTPGDIFRSVPIKGLQLETDMSMLPDSMQQYAPVVRGVAQSRARLEIRQNGLPIYSTYVSAGPYEITDLTTASGNGELEIILTEADGQERRFTQPYATLNNLLREGVWRYSASLGHYNAASRAEDSPLLWEGTLATGVGWQSTLYGGLMASNFYRATTVGIGKNLGVIGALALDVTQSAADVEPVGQRHEVQGMSYAIKYGKRFDSRTNVRFAGYRYSTEGYRDFSEAVRERSDRGLFAGSRRSLLEASVFQDIGSNSSLSLTLSQADYWNTHYQQRQFQLNFTTRHRSVSYSVYASQALNNDPGGARQAGLSISMPLDIGRSSSATFDIRESNGQYNQRASLNGRGTDNRLSYRASVTNDERNQQSGEVSMGYQAPYASLGAGLSQGSDYSNLSLNASGALLAHEEGIALGPYLGETSGLVHVPDISGVGVLNGDNSKTNASGYALIPYLQPYRVNRVILDTHQLEPSVQIDNGVTQVVPRRGAVVKASFAARTIHRLVLTLRDAHGAVLPFGAQVSHSDSTLLGVVGQGGQALLGTDGASQVLTVRWGSDNAEHCQVAVDVQALPVEQGYRMAALTCR